jgi:hypothetical protein
MLRLLVIFLLLANAGFFVWQEGMLFPWLGDFEGSPREPQRLAQQVRPERLVLAQDIRAPEPEPPASVVQASGEWLADVASEASSSGAEAASLPAVPTSAGTSSAAGSQCLEAGPYSRDEESQIQTVLTRNLPAGSWKIERFPVPGLWLIYMGPYPDTDSMQRKQSELQRILGASFEEVRSPIELRMGFSLGRFNSQVAADAALNALQTKGVRTARVISVRPPMEVSVIRVPSADARTQQLLLALPLPAERGFVGCLAP